MKSAVNPRSLMEPRYHVDHQKSDRARIEELVSSGQAIALFLDIDGTLLEVALTPSAVRVPHYLADLLASLSTLLDGALAIITGRRIDEADLLLTPFKSAAAGVHGAEMRKAPDRATERLSPAFNSAAAHDIRAIADRMPGIVLENKGSGIALHYRLAPELQGDLLLALQNLLPRHNRQFTICGGRKVIEVLPVGFSKGRALHQMASLPSFANRIPVMIGDDIADQDAFVAAKELNGFGLKVAGENFPAAEADFDSPAEVLAWLARILQLGTESRASGIRSLRTSN